MQTRYLALLLCTLLAVPAAHAQRMTKEEERARFHPTPVRGMDAAEWRRGYEQRLQLKRDSIFGGIAWRNIGPEIQGGRVIDVVAPLDSPDNVYVAFATGGIYRTTDDGITWESIFDDHSAFGIGAMDVSRDGRTLWVGTGEANSQRTSYAGTGVYKSTDSGKTWRHMGLPASHHIGELVIHPRNSNIVYVAVLGNLYSQNPERGLYKTTDGGNTWEHVLKADEYTGAFDVALDPRNPDVVIATMWDRDRRAWNFRESGTGSAVFRSENGGRTWTKVRGLPEGVDAGRIDVAFAPSNGNIVYAVVDHQGDDEWWLNEDERVPAGRLTARRFLRLNDELLAQLDERTLAEFLNSATRNQIRASDVLAQVKSGSLTHAQLTEQIKQRNPGVFEPPVANAVIYRSDDGGRNFRPVSRGDDAGYQYYFARVVVNPRDANDLITMGLYLLRSSDGGQTWRRIARNSHVDYHAIWYDPRNSDKLWVGNDGGIYLSGDGGDTVRHLNNLSVGQATTVGVDNKRPYNVYIGLQDNGTMRGPSNYVPGRSSLNAWTSLGGGDGSAIFVDPRNGGDLVYVASQFGGHSAVDQATGQRWSTRPTAPRGDAPARFNWISPLILSPHHPDIVYVGAQRLYRSFNQGRNYQPISPDLTKNVPNGDVPFSTIKDVSESRFRFGLIYVGCDDGNVQVTHDGGRTWDKIPTPQPDKWVSRIVASRHDEATVYAAQSGYRDDDFAPYLFKSTDYGKTWRSIVGNLPAGETINALIEDPARPGVLYVGTDMGVWISYDDGAKWETLHGEMPHQPVHDLVIQERDNELVAATHSRGVYILPLAQVHEAAAQREKDVHVFAIPNVTRGNPGWGFENRPRWDASLPTIPSARVTFFVREPGDVKVRIKGADGNVLKEITVQAVRGLNVIDLGLDLVPPQNAAPDRNPPTTVQQALADPFAARRGQYLERGDYTVEIESGGKTATSTLRIVAPAN
jgi:photosystem II stability/assembly factor-like uncharacterized protein